MPKIIADVKFYTVTETAAVMQVTAKTVRAWIINGRIKSIRIGRPILISEQHLKSFIEENTR